MPDDLESTSPPGDRPMKPPPDDARDAWGLGGRVLNLRGPMTEAALAEILLALEAEEAEKIAHARPPPGEPWLDLVQVWARPSAAAFDWLERVLFRRWPQVTFAWELEAGPHDFLPQIPSVRRLRLTRGGLDDLAFLSDAPDHLTGLIIGQERGRSLNLADLGNLRGLTDLGLVGKIGPLAAIRALPGLRKVSLFAGQDKRHLRPLLELAHLEDLALHGGSCDLATLPGLRALRRLRLAMPRGATGLDFLAGCTALEEVELYGLGAVRALPDLSALTRLRVVHLHAVKGITDLSPLAALPALEELSVGGPSVAAVEDLRCFEAHPRLRVLRVWFAGRKQTAAFEAWRDASGLTDGFGTRHGGSG